MARISLKEAYDNRDVIAWLVKYEDEIDELMNILKDIDPDGDLTNVVTKTGDQTIDGIKTFIGKIVADCDIIQNGGNYETHAEQVFTTNDYIVMRDGAVSGLGTGQFSGFQVKKYNGSDDGRLVMDNAGVARVGDIGDEQPLMTRSESGSMTDGRILEWDATNEKAVTSAKAVSDLVAGSGNIGSDIRPIKIANGTATAVANDLIVSGGNAGYKWILKSGYSTMRFQSSTSHSVTINIGMTAASPNNMFPMVTLAYNGNGWAEMSLNVSSRSATGFTVSSYTTAAGIDITADFFWMVLIPVAL